MRRGISPIVSIALGGWLTLCLALAGAAASAGEGAAAGLCIGAGISPILGFFIGFITGGYR